MADTDIPADLIELRIAFLAAENRHAEVCRDETGTDEERKTREKAAFDAMAELALAIHRHPWWDAVGSRYAAEVRMRQAAREAMAAAGA